MYTFEARAKQISKKLDPQSQDHDIEWACKKFWSETDIAIRKHILVSLLKVIPEKNLNDLSKLLIEYSEEKKKENIEIVHEVYNWSLF